jgi:hypothetical protein
VIYPSIYPVYYPRLNTRALPIIDLGGFVQGSVPPPIEHTFYDEDGARYDLTTWTISAFSVNGPGPVTGTPVLDPDSDGTVVYEWGPDDMSVPGTYEGIIWVQDDALAPSLKLASGVFTWRVYPE